MQQFRPIVIHSNPEHAENYSIKSTKGERVVDSVAFQLLPLNWLLNQSQRKPKHAQKTIKHIVKEHSSAVGRVENKRETLRWVKGTSLCGKAWSPVYGSRTNWSLLAPDALSR